MSLGAVVVWRAPRMALEPPGFVVAGLAPVVAAVVPGGSVRTSAKRTVRILRSAASTLVVEVLVLTWLAAQGAQVLNTHWV